MSGEHVRAMLACGVTFVSGVPDSALAPLTGELAEGHQGIAYLPATREDNAVALAVGAWLGGASPLVFMKSMGLGNATDALTSLAQVYGVPLPLYVSWHGYLGRDVPHHNVLGEVLADVLAALRIPVVRHVMGEGTFKTALAETVALARDRGAPAALLGVPAHLAGEAHDAA
ncbi:thiamine pyrophosphate-binding protein [Sphaerisporangium aureirubrum]|uniref:Thiamine pyrophosphate-binding protein n=1 Tax=Sphaerisporangium aureirubrum TaxID=1544736 RepID=A0ABW1NLU1_9ACTN